MIKPKHYSHQNIAVFAALVAEAMAQPNPAAYVSGKIDQHPHRIAMLSILIDSTPNGQPRTEYLKKLGNILRTSPSTPKGESSDAFVKEIIVAAETVIYADPVPIEALEGMTLYWRQGMRILDYDASNSEFLKTHMYTALMHAKKSTLINEALRVAVEVVPKIGQTNPILAFKVANSCWKKAKEIGAETWEQTRQKDNMQAAFKRLFEYNPKKALEIAAAYIGRKHPLRAFATKMVGEIPSTSDLKWQRQCELARA